MHFPTHLSLLALVKCLISRLCPLSLLPEHAFEPDILPGCINEGRDGLDEARDIILYSSYINSLNYGCRSASKRSFFSSPAEFRAMGRKTICVCSGWSDFSWPQPHSSIGRCRIRCALPVTDHHPEGPT